MANTYTPNMNLAKPAKGDTDWDDEINGNSDKTDPLGVEHDTGDGASGRHANTVNVGDGTGSPDKKIVAYNADANKPYIAYDEATNKWVIANNGVDEYEIGQHFKTVKTWIVSTDGDDTNGDGSWERPYATLSKAVTEAATGDAILMLPGTYAQGGAKITVNKVVYICGLGGREGVKLTGNSSTYLLEMTAACIVENLDITMTGSSGNQVAVRIAADSVVLRRMRISNEATGASSHAVTIETAQAVRLEDVRIAAYNGYGLNIATSGNNGGGVFKHCEIQSSQGVAVYLADTDCDDMVFDRCEIEGGNGNYGMEFGAVVTGTILRYCVVKKEGAATESIHVSAAMNAVVYLCALNAALDADLTNNIATPYNVVDADI